MLKKMKTELPQFLGLTATGLMAGAFLYGLLNVVPTFYEVPITVHLIYRIQLMNHNGITMQILMAASIICPIWYAVTHKHVKSVMAISLLSAVLALISLLITRFGNVPINHIIKTWSASQLPSNWQFLLHKWDQYNLIRVLAGLGSFLAFMTATHLSYLQSKNLN
jgi:hypothetical protein